MQAFYPGHGHTSDNIVLTFRQALFGGCLIKSMDATDLGFIGKADLASWTGSVQRVAARYPNILVIPDLGPIDLAGASLPAHARHSGEFPAPNLRTRSGTT